MNRLGVTRRQLLGAVDRRALTSLPAEPYEFSEWRTCRVGIDYHVEVAAHYYSVPQIFVGVLGASSFTFAHASWTQALPDWIDAHVRALEAIGGVPHLLVPDNTKTAVIKACLYDPQVNRTYAELATHYGTAILPARPRRPRDKAIVSYCTLS